MKPDGYPLPWSEAEDLPYWKLNLGLCAGSSDWQKWQANKPMRNIIPVIDQMIADKPGVNFSDWLHAATHNS